MRKLAFFFSLLLLLMVMSCEKEYSYEGGNIRTPTDTVHVPVIINDFPVCQACIINTTTELSRWSFESGNSKLCGEADTAIINPDRNAFTFFGPSSCSRDTGMVITVYLDTEMLNRDRTNLMVKGAFYYYDRITPSYIFMSLSVNSFSVTINSYSHQTRIATGTFQGSVFRSNGTPASITAGKFKVKLI
ncbi:MAG: hypothetical protein H7Y01_11455 [Ferruginibacter sp.]|nr:hypothetical protein [Chitinophagaceae bacterium]